MKGREEIRKYGEDGVQNIQTDVTFNAEIISVKENIGYAYWQATFKRIPVNTYGELDGILKQPLMMITSVLNSGSGGTPEKAKQKELIKNILSSSKLPKI